MFILRRVRAFPVACAIALGLVLGFASAALAGVTWWSCSSVDAGGGLCLGPRHTLKYIDVWYSDAANVSIAQFVKDGSNSTPSGNPFNYIFGTREVTSGHTYDNNTRLLVPYGKNLDASHNHPITAYENW